MLNLERLIHSVKAIPSFGFYLFLIIFADKHRSVQTAMSKCYGVSDENCFFYERRVCTIPKGKHSCIFVLAKRPSNTDTGAYDMGQSAIKTTKGLLAAKKKNLHMARLARLYSMQPSKH
jgi:hypothetical protein